MSASDTPKPPKKPLTTQSGVFPASMFEPESPREPAPPPPPNTLPEAKESEVGATTGIMPIVSEGTDLSALRDTDKARGSSS